MSDSNYTSIEHYLFEKRINLLIEEKAYDQAIELMKECYGLFDFKVTITDTQPSKRYEKKN